MNATELDYSTTNTHLSKAGKYMLYVGGSIVERKKEMISIQDFVSGGEAKKWGVVVEVRDFVSRGGATNLMPEPCG